MRIKAQADFWCGLIFIAIGIAFMVYAREYRMGSAARMGPGYFPELLGGLLVVLGATLSLPAFTIEGEKFPRLHLRPLLITLVSIAVFALLLEPAGFVIAVAALVVVGGFADPDLRFVESIGLAVALVVFAIGIFSMLLGLPLSLWPNL